MAHKFLKNISFTELLYGVVVGSAFQRLQFHSFGWDDALLLASFVVIVDDWVLYHSQLDRVDDDAGTFATGLTMDLMVLIAWYALSESGNWVGSEGIAFISQLGIFYLITGLWELVMLKETKSYLRMAIDLPTALVCFAIALIAYVGGFTLAPWLGLIVLALALAFRPFLWKEYVFRRLSSSEIAT